MLRTTCLGWMSLRVRTLTSLTSPSGVVTTRADRMPVSVLIRFSTRFMPHGSGVPVPPPSGKGCCSEAGDGLDVTVPPRFPRLRPDSDRPPWHDTTRDRPPPARLHPSYRGDTRRPQYSPLRTLPDSPSAGPSPERRAAPC